MLAHRSRRTRRLTTQTTLLGLAVALALPASPALSAEPAANLVLHYDFEGSLSTGVVTDRSPSGLNGTLVNPGSASTAAGADGTQAVVLPGGASTSTTAPYVRIPNGLFKNRSAVTISTLFRWSGGPDFQWVYNLGKDLNTATFVTPSYQGEATTRSSIKPVNGSAEVGVPGTQKLPTGQWVNLTTTINGQTITYYINGAKVGSRTATINLATVMHSDTNTTSGFLGKAFWNGHPFLAGALDDFRVYDAALTPAEVADLAGNRLATLTGLAQTSFTITTPAGTAPNLPATVDGQYTDGIVRRLAITWPAISPTQYADRNQFTVTGTVDGTTTQVQANVTVMTDLAIDLGADTGPFHGGASGVLYGLYGEGLPTRNLIEGINLRTVSTKAQDGPQHPGADALEVVKPLADATNGDVYIYMTDIYRGFPYQWPGSTCQERMSDYKQKLAQQVDQVLQLPAEYQDNIVFVPFNEPEGNMFGTGTWSCNKISWLNNPQYFFAAWDEAYALIKGKMPNARIAGPNTSTLYNQVQGFLQHTVATNTVPEVMTWHELSNPAQVRTSVAKYRGWERTVFAGTAYAGRQLPININEYAFNYHTSVPGQMIQWISAIEESKVDADIAYWNIDGNLSDSAVQANRGNGQWWLLNAYGQLTGRTVKVTPPQPNVSYTLQGVGTLDTAKAQAKTIFGGASGNAYVQFRNVNSAVFGQKVHALVQEIPWTGQLGDSGQPEVVAELVAPVVNGRVGFDFGNSLPKLKESSAYQITLAPGGSATSPAVAPKLWQATYEAEDAAHTGTGWSRNGPEGTPSDVAKFYTSGTYNVGGLRTNSDVVLNFNVSVPQNGTYDLSVFANSLNTYNLIAEQGPTNIFLRVDGGAEQELHMPLGYKWVVWDHADTKVNLTAGNHTITLAARNLNGTRTTKGDVIIDKIDLSLPNPAASQAIYEAEHATLAGGARTLHNQTGVSGAGVAAIRQGQSVNFWVYSPVDGESAIDVDVVGSANAGLSVNGQNVGDVTAAKRVKAFLSGGINKITLTGKGTTDTRVDRLRVQRTQGTLVPTWYEAENAQRAGTAAIADYSLASGGRAVTNVGGDPGNGNTLTFTVNATKAGVYALTVRYSNPEQAPATHYNPDPLARHADISINGQVRRVMFPHSFHANNYWELTIPVQLVQGQNAIRFSAAELPNFDGTTYASDTFPGVPLRSKQAPIVDRIGVTPFADTLSPLVG
ncbi:LamG-like jellyroll fold domain-containing protein [Micromonospora sp. KC721]|uniref:LamG-like jellyroll fold domain-containing protein n=1 Tax=Micromonospora sp. KC721 TaxID=2530380 RepID=UPI001045367C|nr:LamG-like jellyroll fold domain-containing protein [Micromonospora sp. KC721]TDB73021.1 cellulosome enzyme [Micromonospora sp. KC721]